MAELPRVSQADRSKATGYLSTLNCNRSESFGDLLLCRDPAPPSTPHRQDSSGTGTASGSPTDYPIWLRKRPFPRRATVSCRFHSLFQLLLEFSVVGALVRVAAAGTALQSAGLDWVTKGAAGLQLVLVLADVPVERCYPWRWDSKPPPLAKIPRPGHQSAQQLAVVLQALGDDVDHPAFTLQFPHHPQQPGA